jgi:hypothetical protein
VRFPGLLLLLPLLLPVVCGCGGSAEGEFRPIANVEDPVSPSSGDAVAADDSPADAPAADSADSSQRDPAPVEASAGDPSGVEPAVAEDVDPGGIEHVAAVDVAPSEAVEPTAAVAGDAPQPAGDGQEGKSLVPAPTFKRERSGALRVTFDDLDLNRVLGIDKPTEETPAIMPAWQTDLVGKRVRIRGYMKPFEYTTDLPSFPLVRDNGVCCFGPMAKLYDKVHVYLREGDTIDLQSAPLDVEGTFDIAPFSLGGELQLFYILEDAVVIR